MRLSVDGVGIMWNGMVLIEKCGSGVSLSVNWRYVSEEVEYWVKELMWEWIDEGDKLVESVDCDDYGVSVWFKRDVKLSEIVEFVVSRMKVLNDMGVVILN